MYNAKPFKIFEYDISMPVIKFPNPVVPEIDQLDHQELLPVLMAVCKRDVD